MKSTCCDCSSSEVSKQLQDKGELRVQSFTEERISSLKKQILSAYKCGLGIRGSEFCQILFGYQQALYMYEGIAYHFFGLVATRRKGRKKGPLYLVSIAEAGKTAYPVLPSSYHSYDKTTAVRNVIDEAMQESEVSDSTQKDSVSKSDKLSSKAETSQEILSMLFGELSEVYSKLSEVVKSC